jgi:hypothetical protein
MKGGICLAKSQTRYLTCIICGKKYAGCRSCDDATSYKAWRSLCDTPQHFQIYRIIQELNLNAITLSEAKEMLSRIGVYKKDIDSLLPSVKAILEPVFARKQKVKEPVEVPVEKPAEESAEPEVLDFPTENEE